MKITIILNSGKEIVLDCEKFTFTHDPGTLRITSYSIEGLRGTRLTHLVLNEVAAVTRDMSS